MTAADPATALQRLRGRLRRPLRRWYRRWVVKPQAAYVVSFPKSGRTWLRLLLAQIFAELTARPLSLDLTNYRHARRGIPYVLFSHDGTDPTEWRADLTDKQAFAGRPVLLLVRDPRDVAVSYYFDLTRRSHRFAGTLEVFLESPQYGVERIIDFLNSWAAAAAVPSRFQVLRYEDLHTEPKGTLRRALEFFGVADVSDEMITRAVDRSTFAAMREMEARQTLGDGRMRPADPDDPESFKVRRGRVGGYAEYLSATQVAYVAAQMRRLGEPFRSFWK